MVEGIKRWKEEGEEVQEARKNYEVSQEVIETSRNIFYLTLRPV